MRFMVIPCPRLGTAPYPPSKNQKQSPTAPTGFGNSAASSTLSPFGGGGTLNTGTAPTALMFGAAPSPIGMQQQQQASPFAAPPSGRGDPAVLKGWLTEVYSRFKPDNLQKIDKIMTKYT